MAEGNLLRVPLSAFLGARAGPIAGDLHLSYIQSCSAVLICYAVHATYGTRTARAFFLGYVFPVRCKHSRPGPPQLVGWHCLVTARLYVSAWPSPHSPPRFHCKGSSHAHMALKTMMLWRTRATLHAEKIQLLCKRPLDRLTLLAGAGPLARNFDLVVVHCTAGTLVLIAVHSTYWHNDVRANDPILFPWATRHWAATCMPQLSLVQ
jgi:hypothetical protein